jgi:outer membrane protein assembly factor BamD (BamD/ComL family)
MGNAIFSYLSGLQPQTATDINTMSWTRQTEKDMQKDAEERFIKEYHRGLKAMDDKNPTQAAEYFNRANVYLVQSGYPEEEQMKLRARAVKDYESMAGNITWDYFNEKVPETRKPAAQKALPQALQQLRKP